MCNKKKVKSLEKYRQVFVNEDLTALRSKMVRVLKNEASIKSVWTIEGNINCIYEHEGHKIRKTSNHQMIYSSWVGQRPILDDWVYTVYTSV